MILSFVDREVFYEKFLLDFEGLWSLNFLMGRIEFIIIF